MGKLYVVATPIGNLSDISKRALDILSDVGLIAAEDTRRTLKLLNHFGIKTPIVSYHKFNEAEKSQVLIHKIKTEDMDIALVSDAGTPCISDPGAIIVKKARENNIDVIGIPGSSALTASLSVCGLLFDSFSFFGFYPREKKNKEKLKNLLISSDIDTFVFYESPNRIIKSLTEISLFLPGCNVFLINDLTKFYEKSIFGEISHVIERLSEDANSNLGEYTFIIQKARKDKTNDGKPEEGHKDETEDAFTIEALLVNEIVKHNCSLKQAINLVSKNTTTRNISKNDAYKASLNLKKIFIS